MPTGWRPEDVATKYPIKLQPISRAKYQTQGTRGFKSWAWVQLAINNGLLFYMLTQFGQGQMDSQSVLIYAFFMLCSIMAYTSLMDRSRVAVPLEVAKFGVLTWILIQYDGWFGLNEFLPFGNQLVLAYGILSLAVALYFTFGEAQQRDLAT